MATPDKSLRNMWLDSVYSVWRACVKGIPKASVLSALDSAVAHHLSRETTERRLELMSSCAAASRELVDLVYRHTEE